MNKYFKFLLWYQIPLMMIRYYLVCLWDADQNVFFSKRDMHYMNAYVHVCSYESYMRSSYTRQCI
jgi:hypothetical protein